MNASLSSGNYKDRAARIQLKNGIHKYGVILENESNSGNWKFISNDHLQEETINYNYVEVIPENTIYSIDIYLK